MKIGKLSYLNNAPMYYGLAKTHPHFTQNCQIVEGPPSYLNRCIQQKKIDLSVVSSIEYAKNCEHYLILPDLSISSDGPVQSVLLLSRVPIKKLHKQLVLLSSDSETSVALIKIILSQQEIEPVYVKEKIRGTGEGGEGNGFDCAACLVIGDRALQLKASFPFVYDLGQEWKSLTGLPFVFALWVVRQEALEQIPVLQIWQALRESRNYSLSHLEELISSVQAPAGLSKTACVGYLHNLRYELSERYQEGLKTYYHFLHTLGEIPHPVPELRFVSYQRQLELL